VRNTNQLASVFGPDQTTPLGAYIATVLDPFYAQENKGRVPSIMPFPTASITMKYTGTLTPNASGNFAVVLLPQFGTDLTPFVHTLAADTLNANEAIPWSVAFNAVGTQGRRTDYLADAIYSSIRCVGAGLRVWYVGKDVDRSGYFHSTFMPRAPTIDTNRVVRAYSEDVHREAQYTMMCSNKQVAECVWVPRDDTDYNFIGIGGTRNTSHCLIQGYGLPLNPNCIKWEVILHMEYLPDPTAANARLLSTDISYASKEDASKIIAGVLQEAPHYVASPNTGKDLFSSLKRIGNKSVEVSKDIITGVLKGYLSDLTKPNMMGMPYESLMGIGY
jgi:hypothetical protein